MALLKFLKGNYSGLNSKAISEGQILICGDTGEMFVDVASDKRVKIGDFITVANITALEALDATAVPTSRLYYVEDGNILARSNGTTWVQVNKQKSAAELKEFLGLGSLAYLSEVSESNLNAELKAKVNAAAEGNHSHDNKELLDTYTQTEANLADAVAKKHSHTFVEAELNKIVDGDVAKWNAAEGNAKAYADEKIAALDYTDTAVAGEYVSAVNEVDGKISVTRVALPDYTNTYDAKGAAATAESNAKSYADGLAANYDAKGTAAGVKTELEAEIAKKVDKVEGKSLVSDTEITKLAGVSEGANKVEASTNNGSIKIDGVETVVYTHPEKHAIADVTGLQDALDGLQAKGDYAAEEHTHTKADITDFAHTHTKSEITDFAHTHTASEVTDLDATIKTYGYATTSALNDVDAKFADYTKTADLPTDLGDFTNNAGYAKTADVNTELDKKADKTQVATDIANAIAPLATTEALNEVKATAEAARTEDEVNAQIDAKITALNLGTAYEPVGAEDRAKAYVDQKFTDADLAQYTTEQEVKDIVDGVIAGAADSETYNSLTKLVDYIDTHGGEASEMAQAIETLEGKVDTIEKKPAYSITDTQISNWDGEVGAKALAETKTTTAEVKTQIEAYGYATEADLTLAENRIAALEAIDHEAYKEYADQAEADAIAAAAEQDVVVLAEAQAYADQAEADAVAAAEGKVNTLASNVYTKSETYTQDEVDAAIEAALTNTMSWGEF